MVRSRFARVLAVLEVTIIAALLAPPAFAHVGSPDVFWEGEAGPYHLFVAVIVPQVIPGVAEVQVRDSSGEVQKVSTAVTRLTGAGSQYAPIPDVAIRSSVDPRLFNSSIWLMQYGSLRVLLKVSGDRGGAEVSVPVASFARQNLAMPRWLGALLLALTVGLAIGAVSIIGAAVREARLASGSEVSATSRRSGRIAMAVGGVIVATIFYFAFVWWNYDAREFQATTRFFKPPRMTVTLDGADRIRLSAADPDWASNGTMNRLVPDHGHLMHLFLIRTPAFDRFWHLHPDRNEDRSFEAKLPALDAGHYDVFADVVEESGFPWTLVGAIDLPQISGAALSPDDSGGSFAPIGQSRPDASVDVLSDGTRVIWQHGELRANNPMALHFTVQNRDGSPATDLQPYMGMAAHLEVVRNDLSVFAHIHPSGSAPMPALMLASNGNSMPGMAMAEKIAPELSMPYGFPKPGVYRIFVQFKRAGKIETASFDADVN